MDLINGEVIDQAIEAFHVALDRHLDDFIHGRDGDWVDGSVEAVVEALLVDGWQPPEPAEPRPMSRPTHLKLVHSLVQGQEIELVIEDSATGAMAEVTGTVTEVTETGPVNMVRRAHIRGRACRFPATDPSPDASSGNKEPEAVATVESGPGAPSSPA